MKRRVLSVFLTLIMLVGMSACGSAETSAAAESTTAAAVDTSTSAEAPASSGALELKFKSEKKDAYVIGLANGYWGNTWRAQMVEDFETRANEYKASGVIANYMVSNTNSDATEQLNQINAMIDAGVDAILIDPVSPTTIKSAVEKAQAAGILVVIANDPAYYPGTVCVCGDNYTWMKIQTEWMVEQLGGKGNIVAINGVAGNSADTLRNTARDEILVNYPDIKMLAEAPGSWSQTEAQRLMTTFLSSYENIDGILEQDVMAEGVIKAYENAGKDLPIMTGDYTKSFLKKWSTMEDLNSIGVSYAPGNVVPALDIAIRLLQGKTLKPELLVANPMDAAQKNAVMVAPPYVVTKDGDGSADWAKGLPETTKLISLEEALSLMTDAADTAALDGYPDQAVIDTYFD